MSGATLTMTTCLTSVAFIPALCNPFYFYQLSQKGKFKLKKAEETKFDISFCYIKMKLSKQMTGTARGFRFGGGGEGGGEVGTFRTRNGRAYYGDSGACSTGKFQI